MKFKYILHGYCNHEDVGLENNFNTLKAPYYKTYIQLIDLHMYVTFILQYLCHKDKVMELKYT